MFIKFVDISWTTLDIIHNKLNEVSKQVIMLMPCQSSTF